MEEFMSGFIVIWLYLILGMILIGTIKVFKENKLFAFNGFRNKKLIIIIIILIIILSTFIKLKIYSPFFIINNADGSEYAIEAEGISSSGRFQFVCDPPGYPVLLSLTQSIGADINSGFIINLAASILSVLLIFIFVQLLFGNYLASLSSTFLLAFSPIYNGSVIIGYPMALSLMFLLLSFIILILAIKKNSIIAYSLVGIIIGFAFHMSYLESIFVLIAFVWITICKGFRFLLNVRIWLLLLTFSMTIIPFIILQQTSSNTECITLLKYPRFSEPNNFICKFARNYCGLSNVRYLFKNSEIKENLLNDAEGNLPSYLSFLFFGYGLQDHTLTNTSWKRINGYGYDYLSILFFLIIVITISISLKNRANVKSIYCLLVLLFVYLSLISLYYGTLYFFSAPAEVLFRIPMISLGLSFILLRIKHNTLKWVFFALVLLLFISQLFIHLDFAKPNLRQVKEELFCNRYDPYKEPCHILYNKIDWSKALKND